MQFASLAEERRFRMTRESQESLTLAIARAHIEMHMPESREECHCCFVIGDREKKLERAKAIVEGIMAEQLRRKAASK